MLSPRSLEPVDSLWNPAIYWRVREDCLLISAVKNAGLREVSAAFAVSATVSQRNQHQAPSGQENVRKPNPACLKTKFLLKSKTSRNCNPMPRCETEALHRSLVWIALFLCFRSGDVQRAVPPRLDRVLPLWQRHAHQEPERLGNAQWGQSREPERVDVARRLSPGLGPNHENLTSSRPRIQADAYHWQAVQD